MLACRQSASAAHGAVQVVRAGSIKHTRLWHSRAGVLKMGLAGGDPIGLTQACPTPPLGDEPSGGEVGALEQPNKTAR
jgi:hypothetical protein